MTSVLAVDNFVRGVSNGWEESGKGEVLNVHIGSWVKLGVRYMDTHDFDYEESKTCRLFLSKAQFHLQIVERTAGNH